MPATVTTTTHTHTISLHGLAGWIFWCTLGAFVSFIIGFSSVGWSYYKPHSSHSYPIWTGLWMTCTSQYNMNYADWFKATQAMVTIGFILLIASAIAIFVYVFVMSVHIRKSTLIIVFTALIFIAVVFILIGLIVYGTNQGGTLHWSYVLVIIACILSFAAGILAVVQMKQSNVI